MSPIWPLLPVPDGSTLLASHENRRHRAHLIGKFEHYRFAASLRATRGGEEFSHSLSL